MFFQLLDLLACAGCRGPLTLLVAREEPRTTAMRMAPARRASPPNALVGPLPESSASAIHAVLRPLAAAPAQDSRSSKAFWCVRVVRGGFPSATACPKCCQIT